MKVTVEVERGGYAMREVDEFLEQVDAALRGTGAPLTAQDVLAKRFTPRRLGAGYAVHQVDDLLDAIVVPLLEGTGTYDPDHDYTGDLGAIGADGPTPTAVATTAAAPTATAPTAAATAPASAEQDPTELPAEEAWTLPVHRRSLLESLERVGGMGEKYDPDEVEAFLGRAHDALLDRDGSLTVHDATAERFTPVRFGQGYDMDQVDALIDSVLIPVLRGELEYAPLPPASVGHAPASVGRVPEDEGSGSAGGREPARDANGYRRGTQPSEQRTGLLGRLFGGGR